MKVVIFSGTHSRHLFVNKEIINHFDEVLVVIMQRENALPKFNNKLSKIDQKLFKKHFRNRQIKENKSFGKLDYKKVFKHCKKVYVKPSQLNSKKIAELVKRFDANIAFIFGTDLILPPLIDVLPKVKINLHLGLSPWFKGSATLFWPFYLLKPQYAGITFHEINLKPDSGRIIHQSVPDLEYGDTIHDVGVKCVIEASKEIKLLINFWKKNKRFIFYKQKTSGRVWKGNDFHPIHLRVIYDLFRDKIVDQYLDGKLDTTKPKLYSCLKK